MKKVVITVVAVGLAAVAAQAQDIGARRVTSEVWARNYYANHAAKADTAQAKAEKKAVAAFAKKAEAQYVHAARQQKHFAHRPALGAFADYVTEGRLQEQAAAQQAAAKDTTATAQTATAKQPKAKKVRCRKSNDVYAEGSCWFTRAMGVARHKGETTEQWNARLLAQSLKY